MTRPLSRITEPPMDAHHRAAYRFPAENSSWHFYQFSERRLRFNRCRANGCISAPGVAGADGGVYRPITEAAALPVHGGHGASRRLSESHPGIAIDSPQQLLATPNSGWCSPYKVLGTGLGSGSDDAFGRDMPPEGHGEMWLRYRKH